LDREEQGNVTTAQVTALLTRLANEGLRSRSLSHAKWMLSAVYKYAVATGVVARNPVPDAIWLTTPKETPPTVNTVCRKS
jgi:site-specific recombinase XerC